MLASAIIAPVAVMLDEPTIVPVAFNVLENTPVLPEIVPPTKALAETPLAPSTVILPGTVTLPRASMIN